MTFIDYKNIGIDSANYIIHLFQIQYQIAMYIHCFMWEFDITSFQWIWHLMLYLPVYICCIYMYDFTVNSMFLKHLECYWRWTYTDLLANYTLSMPGLLSVAITFHLGMFQPIIWSGNNTTCIFNNFFFYPPEMNMTFCQSQSPNTIEVH